MLYQIENATVNFRSVQRESASDEVFRVTARAPLKQKRYGPSLVTVQQPDQDSQQHVVLVTGGSSDGQELQSCEYYTPGSDRWRDTA